MHCQVSLQLPPTLLESSTITRPYTGRSEMYDVQMHYRENS
jgi:hypothetical protein